MKPALRALLLLVLLTSAIVLMAIFTEQGSRQLIRITEFLLPVQIEYSSGSLGHRLQLERLRFDADDTVVEVSHLEIELKPACLMRSAICFRYLRADNIDIALLESSTGTTPPDPVKDDAVADTIVFPFALEADNFELGALHIHWLNGQWRQLLTRGSVQIHGSVIEVTNGAIIEPRLTLQDSGSDDESDSAAIVLPSINVPFELVVRSLRLTEPTWNFYGEIYGQDSIVLAGNWVNDELDLTQLDVADKSLGELSLRGGVEFVDNWPLHTTASIQLVSALPGPDLLGQDFTLAAQGDLASIAMQGTGRGLVNLLVEANVNVLEKELPFSAELMATSSGALQLTDLADLPESLSELALTFPITASAEGSLAAQQFKLHTAASGLGYDSTSIALAGSHESGSVAITQLLLRDSNGDNELRVSGTVAVADSIEWSLAVQSAGLTLPDVNDAVQGRISGGMHVGGAAREDHWSVRVNDVQLRGDINGTPARVSGFAGLNSELELSNSELFAELNSASLSLRVIEGERQPGVVSLSVDDIGDWLSGSRGQISAEATVSSDRQHFQVSGNVHDFFWQGLRLKNAALTADYRADAEQAFTVDARFNEIDVQDVVLDSLSLSAKGNTAQQAVVLSSVGEVQGKLSLTGVMQGQHWKGVLAPTQLQTPLGQWRLSESLGLVWSDSKRQVAVDEHCWSHERADLCTGQWFLGPSGSGSVQLSGDMKLFAGLLSPGLDVEGKLQSDLNVSWQEGGDVVVAGQLQTGALTFIQQLAEGESATFGWDSSSGSFKYDNDGLQLDWRLQQEGRNVVELGLQLPSVRENALTGRIYFDRLQLTTLAPFVPTLSTLSGDITGEVMLSGTVDQPLARGHLRLSDGQMMMAGNPTQLDNLELTLNVHGDKADIRGAGTLGGGELALTGQVLTTPDFRLQLAIKGRKQTILYPPSTELEISQDLTLVLARDLLDIGGSVTVHNGSLETQQLPEDSVAISSSVVEVDSDGNVLREELPFATRMNVIIHLADAFKVKGNGFNATLGGELEVKQSPGLPLQLFGNLRTIGGELYAYQSHLNIMRGTISFSGPPANPTLDLSAERHISAGSVTVGVRVQGPLEEDLQLTLYSDPAMSQTDTLSYLVRGRGMDVGAGGDGTALALSLASGVVNRSMLVEELNRIPGLNNVSFGAQGSENDTAATVSGYIGERIYLSYGIGFYEPINVLTARLYLRSRIWLEVISSIENSVDLYYSFDIE